MGDIALQSYLECALEGDVGGAAPHQPDKVVVLDGTAAVGLDVAHELGIELGGRVEPEAHRDLAALEVAVDRLGAADHAAVLTPAFMDRGADTLGR